MEDITIASLKAHFHVCVHSRLVAVVSLANHPQPVRFFYAIYLTLDVKKSEESLKFCTFTNFC